MNSTGFEYVLTRLGMSVNVWFFVMTPDSIFPRMIVPMSCQTKQMWLWNKAVEWLTNKIEASLTK